MQHNTSIIENAASTILSVVRTSKNQEPTQIEGQPNSQVKVIAMAFSTALHNHTTRRRYTIDDNGGSYEGL
jgi:hypothetical protein